MTQLTADIPSGAALRQFRTDLGISKYMLAEALGFGPNGHKTVHSWEDGWKDGEPFKITPTAWAAFRYLIIAGRLYWSIPDCAERTEAAAMLPGVMR